MGPTTGCKNTAEQYELVESYKWDCRGCVFFQPSLTMHSQCGLDGSPQRHDCEGDGTAPFIWKRRK